MQVTVRCLACLALLMSIIALTSSAPANVTTKTIDEIIDEEEVKGNFGRSIFNVKFFMNDNNVLLRVYWEKDVFYPMPM